MCIFPTFFRGISNLHYHYVLYSRELFLLVLPPLINTYYNYYLAQQNNLTQLTIFHASFSNAFYQRNVVATTHSKCTEPVILHKPTKNTKKTPSILFADLHLEEKQDFSHVPLSTLVQGRPKVQNLCHP